MFSNLQLENYVVSDLTFKCNETSEDSQKLSPRIGMGFTVKSHSSDEDRFLITMEIDVNKPDRGRRRARQLPKVQIHVVLYGWFRFNKGLETEVKHKMIHTNGSSILYGVARGIVAQLTGSLGFTRLVLPSVNIQAIIERHAKAQAGKQRTKLTAKALH